MHQDIAVDWHYPTRLRLGDKRVSDLMVACRELNIQAPLLVSDPGLLHLDMTESLLGLAREAGLDLLIFSDLKSNPNEHNVLAGVAYYKQTQRDGMIAFGGGSAIDVAKAIALMVGQTGDLWDYEDKADNWRRVNADAIAPLIAIPTTAGTGSEVGRASVITDSKAGIKKILFHPNMMPDIVILDPSLCLSLPANLTAATGMDAFSHNLEAYCSPAYHPLADGIAMQGMALIKEFLPVAYEDGQNKAARMQMLVASMMGATAFQKGLGAMHALSHAFGALYDAHHGRLNAVLMPYVLKANQLAIEVKIIALARFLSLEPSFEAFLQWLMDFRQALGIEHSLAELGIDKQYLARTAKMAFEDAAAQGNPVPLSEADYYQLAADAIDGRYL